MLNFPKGHKYYVIGAGISGLASAYFLLKNNIEVEIFEASPIAGGRCRSYFDEQLDCIIDNGNHLILGANKNFLKLIKDLKIQDRYNYFSSGFKIYNVPGLTDYLKNLDIKQKSKIFQLIFFPSDNKVLADYSNDGFFKLVVESILNTSIYEASPRIFSNVLRKIIFSKNGLHYLYPKKNWDHAIISPLLEEIKKLGGKIHLSKSAKKIYFNNNVAEKIKFTDGSEIPLKKAYTIVATPTYSIDNLLEKDINNPKKFFPIINIHFKVEKYFDPEVLGFLDSDVDWIFFKGNIISTTKSVANDLINLSDDILIERSWNLIKDPLGLQNYISARVIKEKRATFSCDKENLKLRPRRYIGYKNLFLTGDYIENSLPSTIEGCLINADN